MELTVTTAILAMLATASMSLVRTSYTAWNRHRLDNEKRQSASALLRHITRKVRQATAVLTITPSTDSSGSLSVVMPNGDFLVWEHDNATKEVRYGIGTATEVLATGIEQLTFYGYKSSFSLTTDPNLIHTVLMITQVQIPRLATTTTETWYSSVHLRTW